MIRSRILGILVVCGLAAATAAISAHHSFAMYDSTKPITLRGRVTQFRWVNPHSTFALTTDPAPGEEPVVWVLEMSSPSNMTRIGWTRNTLTSGDHLEVTASPMRDGSHGAACRQIRFLDKDGMMECGAGTAIRAGEKP